MMGFHVLSRKRKVLETTTDYPNYQQYTRNFSNMINYIYNQLYNLQGLFVRVSDREEWSYSHEKRGSVVVEVARIKPDPPYGP